MGKPHIVHIIHSLESGGCEHMLLRSLPKLTAFDHTIVTLKQLGELAPKFVDAGITVETVHCKGFSDIPGILRLRKLVQEESPDIVITYLFHADVLGRLVIKTRAPIIPFLRTTYNHPKYLVARIFEWCTKPLVRQYLANSEAVKDFYIKHLGVAPEKITVIPNGIDIASFDALTTDTGFRASLHISPDDFVIICVANFHPNKGHRYLLEAFEQLSSSIPPARGAMSRQSETEGWEKEGMESKKGFKLLLVGDGIERRNLEQQIEHYQSKNDILFLGKRADVPKLLKISNLFVLPTLFEGQSNALLEAMAAGLPIITTDIPENHTLIANGENGILATVKDIPQLAQSMNDLFRDPSHRKKLGENAQRFVRTTHSLEHCAQKWNEYLKKSI